MGYFLLGVFLLLALLIASKALANADPKAVAKGLRLGAAAILGTVAAFLAFTGRFAIALPVAVAALMMLKRGFGISLPGGLGGGRSPSSGGSSAINTEWVAMELDHDSGEMDGLVLHGRHNGRNLSELSREEALELLEECAEDADTVALLETYLDRRFGADWRESRAQAGSEGGWTEGQPSRSGRMSREEALDILELEPDADEDAIREAHHRLMKRVHPDHGGSSYLAAKINEAKDILLGP